MLNRVVLIGRLTRDPELRYIPSGVSVTRFTLAVDRNYQKQQGESSADFIPIVVWRALGENCAKYLTKGRLVAVSGRIQTGSYEAQDGSKRYTTEVVADEVQFLEKGSGQSGSNPGMQNFSGPDKGMEDSTNVSGMNPVKDFDGEDELPF